MKVLIIIILVYICYRQAKGFFSGFIRTDGGHNSESGGVDGVLIKDPVCGVYFKQDDGIELSVGNQKIVFCSKKCRDRFLESGEV